MINTNYHTHTYRCGHADGNEEDYVLEAIKNNYTELGMSDHGPFEDDSFGFRMPFSDFKDYIDTINNLKVKYKDKINILLSVEIEYFDEYLDFYKSLLNDYKLDYLTLGQHMLKDSNGNIYFDCDIPYEDYCMIYANELKKAMDTKLFKLIAHPDYYLKLLKPWNDVTEKAANIIIDAAIENDCVLEMNANGVRKGLQTGDYGIKKYIYPDQNFFRLASKKKAKIIINSDCHNPCDLHDDAIIKTEKMANNWGIKLVDKL